MCNKRHNKKNSGTKDSAKKGLVTPADINRINQQYRDNMAGDSFPYNDSSGKQYTTKDAGQPVTPADINRINQQYRESMIVK